MNEFQRKLLDAVQFTSWVAAFADPNRMLLGVESYAYVIDQRGVNIDGLAAQNFPVVMDGDAEFVCTYIAAGARVSAPVIANPANGNQVIEFSPALDVQITDEAAGKTWFDQPTALPLIAGAGGFPFILASPRITKPRSTLNVAVQGSLAQASPPQFADFFFVFHGAKLYYSGATP